MAKEWLTLMEFARRKNLHHSTVQEKIQKGFISKAAIMERNGKPLRIEIEQATLDLERNTDPVFQNGYRQSLTTIKTAPKNEDPDNVGDILPKTKPPAVPKAVDTIEEIDGKEVKVTKLPPANVDDPFADFRSAKTSTEQLRARKLELEVEEREGRLLDIDDVRKTVTKLVSETRAALNNIPSKISPIAVSITDIVEMETMIQKEINDTLKSLSTLTKELGTQK